ncbi:hypothetical protein M758_8G078300 [Ceratodon purpureus]|nr:hypothetical protein M758_8G078300 [Ceratodon purpureus]
MGRVHTRDGELQCVRACHVQARSLNCNSYSGDYFLYECLDAHTVDAREAQDMDADVYFSHRVFTSRHRFSVVLSF